MSRLRVEAGLLPEWATLEKARSMAIQLPFSLADITGQWLRAAEHQAAHKVRFSWWTEEVEACRWATALAMGDMPSLPSLHAMMTKEVL